MMKKFLIKLSLIKHCFVPLLFIVSKTSYSGFLLWRTRLAIEQQQKLVDRFFDRANLINPINRRVMVRELIEIDRRLATMRSRVRVLAEKTRQFATLERQVFLKAMSIIFRR